MSDFVEGVRSWFDGNRKEDHHFGGPALHAMDGAGREDFGSPGPEPVHARERRVGGFEGVVGDEAEAPGQACEKPKCYPPTKIKISDPSAFRTLHLGSGICHAALAFLFWRWHR